MVKKFWKNEMNAVYRKSWNKEEAEERFVEKTRSTWRGLNRSFDK